MAPKGTKIVYLPERRDIAAEDVLRNAVRDHETALRRFLRSRLANHPDQEDLVQEIYLRLARQKNLVEKLSHGEASTRSYLFSVATNLIRDMYRSAAVRQECSLQTDGAGPLKDMGPSPEEALAARQDLASLKRAILKLNPKSRRAFVLSRFNGMSYREIADEMNVSVSMVEKHIMLALAEIRQRVGHVQSFDQSLGQNLK